MAPEPETEILEMAAKVLGGARPAWDERICWRPMLDLAMRTFDARAGWIRFGPDLRVVADEADEAALTDWLEPITGLGPGADLDETREAWRAVGVTLAHAGGGPMGSVGVVLAADHGCTYECSRFLADLAGCFRSNLDLLRDAEVSLDALHALRVLAKAVSNMQLGLTITDAERRIVYTNPAEAAMHGYAPGDLIGEPGSVLAPPDLSRSLDLSVDRSDASWTRESVNRHRDGHDFPVLLWSDVIEGRDGGFRGVVTCSENLGPRRAMEAALQRSETMFRAIFDNAPIGLALIGHDTWIIRANPRLATMLGIEEDGPSEHRLIDFVHPDDAPAVTEAYMRMIEGRRDASRIDHRMLTGSNGDLWVHSTLSPVVDRKGREQFWIALIEDSTQRRALEEELRHSQKMEAVGRLAGGVAHDFNNLLTAIVGITELLLLETGRDHPMAEDLGEIHRAAVTAADLTRQLLAFSRRQITYHQVQNLNVIVRDAENMLRRLVGDEVELVISLTEDLDPIVADQSQIEQVILNLLVNARDATGPGDRIELTTSNVRNSTLEIEAPPSGGFVELAVTDSGSGMDAATLEQIFDPFFTTKPKGRGTGLGLSTVYGIVKQAGGHIWVDSIVGVGTTFRIWLPAAEEGEDSPQPAGNPGTVLTLIENPALDLTCVQALNDAGYRVLAADGFDEALSLAETYGDRIHLLLVESDVEGVGAPEIARRLREFREDMAVMVLGGENQPPPSDEAPPLTWVDPIADTGAFIGRVQAVLRGAR